MTVARANKILDLLTERYPEARCELDFESPLELTVAVVLSAQCTDARVNQLTRKLFRKYRTPADYLAVPVTELEQDIRPAGFFRNKAKSIRGIMEAVASQHQGKIPDTMAELTGLPGIGRKTANVILGNAFGKCEGIAVDTHVKRVSGRLALTSRNDPDKIEQDLCRLFQQERWTDINHILIFHGRYTCKARKPLCGECPVARLCPSCATLSTA